jgi:SAM-dependent methyltransferase
MERSSAGSDETARKVLSLCGKVKSGNALFVGDDLFTPQFIADSTGCAVKSAFTDPVHVERAKAAGLDAVSVQLFELPHTEGGFDLVWYNGSVEFDGIAMRLEQLKDRVKKGGIVVYRTLCWLIDPSADTVSYCESRFGKIEPLDRVLYEAKEEHGFSIADFYIAPKSDWRNGLYKPLTAAAQEYENAHPEDGNVITAMLELQKETDMFELHCEEYSYVYYIMKG